eukprot:EC785288.1.p2 GENE.EC785288.1~~EC785288.1.p2  ORF type:complete len:66 (-),score=7.56 EC785288.1:103-300(-)
MHDVRRHKLAGSKARTKGAESQGAEWFNDGNNVARHTRINSEPLSHASLSVCWRSHAKTAEAQAA